jgi:hypothetical protein
VVGRRCKATNCPDRPGRLRRYFDESGKLSDGFEGRGFNASNERARPVGEDVDERARWTGAGTGCGGDGTGDDGEAAHLSDGPGGQTGYKKRAHDRQPGSSATAHDPTAQWMQRSVLATSEKGGQKRPGSDEQIHPPGSEQLAASGRPAKGPLACRPREKQRRAGRTPPGLTRLEMDGLGCVLAGAEG